MQGMRTYDYILAMKEENQAMELESLDDSDFSSDESTDFDSPEKPTLVSRLLCKSQNQVKKSDKPAFSVLHDFYTVILTSPYPLFFLVLNFRAHIGYLLELKEKLKPNQVSMSALIRGN